MISSRSCVKVSIAALLLLAPAGSAWAARVRLHFGAEALCPPTPEAPCPSPECVEWLGCFKACSQLPVPNIVKSFQHPCTGQTILVPLALPCGTPTIEHVHRRTVYNYGSYTVEVRFLPDGSVDVIYNSGLLRAL